jgi:hypothetical protein
MNTHPDTVQNNVFINMEFYALMLVALLLNKWWSVRPCRSKMPADAAMGTPGGLYFCTRAGGSAYK